MDNGQFLIMYIKCPSNEGESQMKRLISAILREYGLQALFLATSLLGRLGTAQLNPPSLSHRSERNPVAG